MDVVVTLAMLLSARLRPPLTFNNSAGAPGPWCEVAGTGSGFVLITGLQTHIKEQEAAAAQAAREHQPAAQTPQWRHWNLFMYLY